MQGMQQHLKRDPGVPKPNAGQSAQARFLVLADKDWSDAQSLYGVISRAECRSKCTCLPEEASSSVIEPLRASVMQSLTDISD